MRLERQTLIGIGNGVLAGALWGGVFLAPQVLVGFSSAQLSVARYLIYGAFALFLLLPRWRTLPQLGKGEWFALGWLSLLGNIIYYVLLGQAVQLAGGAYTSLIIGLLPVIVTLVGTRESGAVPLRTLVMPMVLCCLGVGFIAYEAFQVGKPNSDPSAQALGFICAFGALASWTAYAVGNSRYLVRLTHISSNDWSLLTGVVTGAMALVLGAFVFPMDTSQHSNPDWIRFWLVSAGVAVFASIVGNRFWNQASRLLPMSLMGQMIVFETLFALLYSFLWEQRWPSGLEVVAIVCLMVGTIWCASAHRMTPSVHNTPEPESDVGTIH